MSKVIIDDKYFVVVDTFNHTLMEHNPGGYEVKGVGKRSGETYIKEPSDEVVGYYPNMRQCVAKVVSLKLHNGQDVVELKEYIRKLVALGKELGGKFVN